MACESQPLPSDAGGGDAAAPLDAGPLDPPACEGVLRTPPSPECAPLATDYAPGADDDWPACISDDGEYHRIVESISTIARVGAYEELEALLFDPSRDPSPDDFLNGRLLYQETEGLDSRVVRRYDPHFAVPDGTDCTLDGAPEAYPDYCVGPAVLSPLILSAFEAGITGGAEPPRVHAARVQAALLWFLAVSTYKESLTCTRTAQDCDSAYAYYTGGEAARGGLGLAEDVAAVDPAAHERAWDGLLAVRCWRDLDPRRGGDGSRAPRSRARAVRPRGDRRRGGHRARPPGAPVRRERRRARLPLRLRAGARPRARPRGHPARRGASRRAPRRARARAPGRRRRGAGRGRHRRALRLPLRLARALECRSVRRCERWPSSSPWPPRRSPHRRRRSAAPTSCARATRWPRSRGATA
ncbi:MAG: hypothetical protein M5U28_55530 [Sandaracinaceae bacterium]|nr:hypothetical protein [Sandaracinaceae bacterium]